MDPRHQPHELYAIAEKEVLKDLNSDICIEVSAKTGQGLDRLKKELLKLLLEKKVYIEKTIDFSKAGIIQQIRKNGTLLEEEYVAEGIKVKAYVDKALFGRLKDTF